MAPTVHFNQRLHFNVKLERMQSLAKVYVPHVMRGIIVSWVQLF
jgi:hypothetical protein